MEEVNKGKQLTNVILRTTVVFVTLIIILIISFVVGLNISVRIGDNLNSFAAGFVSLVVIWPIVGVLLTIVAHRLFLKRQIPKIGRISDRQILFVVAVFIFLFLIYLQATGIL